MKKKKSHDWSISKEKQDSILARKIHFKSEDREDENIIDGKRYAMQTQNTRRMK